MDLKKKVIVGLRWSAAAKFLGQLITWGITIVVIRLLSPADYGLMALAGVFVAFLAMLNELGLGAAVIQRHDLDESALCALFGMVLLASVLFYLLLAGAAPLIASFYEEPRLVAVIRTLALQFIIVGFSVLPQSILLREMDFRKIATVDLVAAVAGSLTTLVLALYDQGVWALVWGSLMIRLTSMVGLNLMRPFFRLPRLAVKGMGTIFSFGGYVTLSRILWYFYSTVDTLIVGKVLGNEVLGLYSVGLYLAFLPMEKVSGVINQVAFPAFANVQTEPGAAGRHFLKAVRVMSFFALPILWGISSIAPEIVGIFLGEKWSLAAFPLGAVALVVPIRMISNLMAPATLGLGRPDVSFKNSLLAASVMPLAFFLGISWGLPGVILVWVVVFPVVFLINMERTVKILGIKTIDVITSMLKPTIAALLMYLMISFIKNTDLVYFPSKINFIIYIIFGIVIYTSVIFTINKTGFREIRNLSRQ